MEQERRTKVPDGPVEQSAEVRAIQARLARLADELDDEIRMLLERIDPARLEESAFQSLINKLMAGSRLADSARASMRGDFAEGKRAMDDYRKWLDAEPMS